MPLQRIIEPAGLPISVLEARDHVRQDVTTDDVLLGLYLRAARAFAEGVTCRTLVASRYKLTLDSWPGGLVAAGVPYGKTYGLPPQGIKLEAGPILALQSIKYLDMSGTQQTLASTVYATDFSGLPGRITPKFGQVWPPALPQIGAIEVTYDAGDCAPLSVSGNVFTIVGGLWKVLNIGDAVRLTVSGGGGATPALPAPLALDTDYYIQSLPTPASFTLAATAGGSVIALNDKGIGQAYIGACHDAVRSWLLCRVGALFENREDATIIQRGTLVQVPYMDRLLDPATCYLN